jgi:hypothetical protein
LIALLTHSCFWVSVGQFCFGSKGADVTMMMAGPQYEQKLVTES